ncbi:helix-turn-helix domain-containing protein [Paraglaciecola aquimarina]|uniref:Helix-turn-helix domain-containing protein n=1 Tax=Paraglaciecola algarum TaxID=3050085 RepID=A0ABS9D3B7_9ALTE|nr:AraC family transcriptional regulator [Paraglaciecola sp. G1-23]MCF2946538.1 helix-turn-helix domain-containing protein [Paraglaciecola sp. G1-23]
MLSIPLDTFFYYITPMITGPLMLLILVYYIFVKQQFTADFPFYACFLVSFAIFLMGRSLQFYCGPVLAHLVLYGRFFILFSIGIPSLLIANSKRCGITLSLFSFVIPYLLGTFSAIIFVVVRDGSGQNIIFGPEYGNILLLLITQATYSDVLIIASTALLVFPNLYLFFYHVRREPQLETLYVLVSSLLLGLLFIIGDMTYQYWLFFLGSYITVVCWYWLVYQDIRTMKNQAASLKNELRSIHRTTQPSNISDSDLKEVKELDYVVTNQTSAKNRELVDKTIGFIKANFNKDLELTEIAKYTQVSDSYLIRVFKKVTGKTINQYITSYRIQQAKKLLSRHSVIETSIAVGFKSPSYFSTVFKKSTGLTPVQFKQQNI